MITTTPIADWGWMKEGIGSDKVAECIKGTLAASSILARHRLSIDRPRTRMRVKEKGNPNGYLFDGEMDFPALPSATDERRLVAEVERQITKGEIGAVSIQMLCAGVWFSSEGERQAEALFMLNTSTAADCLTVNLATYSDAWMAYDIRGRSQPEVYEANRPRLASALHELSEYVGDDTDPGDPTWFGVATSSGVENQFDTDGSLRDLWTSFEIPSRNSRVYAEFGGAQENYSRESEGPVRYLTVASKSGVLGYLWAADAENAAGFEPRTAAGDHAFAAAGIWLRRFSEAKTRGLLPSQALTELARAAREGQVGGVVLGPEQESRTLDALRELSGRE